MEIHQPTTFYQPIIKRWPPALNPHKTPIFLLMMPGVILFKRYVVLFVYLFIISRHCCSLGTAQFKTFVSIKQILQNYLAQTPLHLSFVLVTLMQSKIRSYLSIGRDHYFLNNQPVQSSWKAGCIWFLETVGFWGRSCREAFSIWGDSDKIFHSEFLPLWAAKPFPHHCPAQYQFTEPELNSHFFIFPIIFENWIQVK